jgi:general secretion pathway protein G
MKLMQRLSHTRRRHDRAPSDAGFTLIELLVVLVILGLLAGVAAPPVLRYLGRAKTDTAKIQIQSLSNALDLYRLDVGR